MYGPKPSGPAARQSRCISAFLKLRSSSTSRRLTSRLNLVWGLGLARWATGEHAIDLPLVERLVEIEIAEAARGEIRIRPRVAPATVNLRPYDALQIDGVPLALDGANRAIAATGEDGVSPYVAGKL